MWDTSPVQASLHKRLGPSMLFTTPSPTTAEHCVVAREPIGRLGRIHVCHADAVDYTPGSDQWNWLAYDLLKINRVTTPWVTVNIHNPWCAF